MHTVPRFPGTLLINLLLILGLLLNSGTANSQSFKIDQAEASFNRNALSVSARFKLSLSEPVKEALHNGVTIQLRTTLDLYAKRPWIWDKQIAQWAFTYQIRYHALTARYVLTSPQHKEIKSFASLNDLLDDIEEFKFQTDIVSDTLPESKYGYTLQLRITLDNSILPAPLRITTLISSAWRLQSPAYKWSIPGNP